MALDKNAFSTMLQRVGISLRRKQTKYTGNLLMIQLQLAVAQHYFTTTHLLQVLDCIKDGADQAAIVVSLFSRLIDLEVPTAPEPPPAARDERSGPPNCAGSARAGVPSSSSS